MYARKTILVLFIVLLLSCVFIACEKDDGYTIEYRTTLDNSESSSSQTQLEWHTASETKAETESHTTEPPTQHEKDDAPIHDSLWDVLTERTYNLLDPTQIQSGYLNNHGNIVVNDSFFTSDFIAVTAGDTIRVNEAVTFYALCFYDTTQAYLSRITENDHAVVPPEAAFMRMTFLGIPNTITASNRMIYTGDTLKPFVPYRIIKTNVMPSTESIYPPVELILPRRLMVVDGKTISINHQSVVKNWDVTQAVAANIQYNLYPTYNHLSVITGGKQSDRTINFLFTPNYEIGLLQKSMDIVNVPKDAGSGSTKKVLFIGDSKTDANQYTQYLLNMFEEDSMSIELLGTRGNSEQNRHEGRSGWSAENYVENNANRGIIENSPFWNPATQSFDFAYYMQQNGYTSVDYVFINLGTNDSTDNFIHYYRQMIQGIKSYDPNIIIGLWTPAPFATFGGYTHSTNDQQVFLAIQAILDEFDTDAYVADHIYVIPTHLNINTFYDFPWIDVPYNLSSKQTYRVCTDRIHETNGYEHDADVIFGYIKYFATLN
jgi:lysophospholipase L1-like esterase